jgi:tetratricopeptide (TPR) repeat protein
MSSKQYLLEDTPESREMLGKIKDMLISGETANIELVFQILEGGGVNPALATPILAVAVFQEEEKIRKRARRFLKKILPDSLFIDLKKNWDSYSHYYYTETQMSELLTKLTTSKIIHQAELANLALKLTRHGGKFCLENKTAHPEVIFRALTEGGFLSLEGFELKKIPPQIALVENLESIDLCGNPIEEIPDELQNLKHLKQIYFTFDRVSPQALAKLERFFPSIIAQRYIEEAWGMVRQKENEKGLGLMKKATLLQPENSAGWDGTAWILTSLQYYEESLSAVDKAVEFAQSPIEKALYLVNKGSTFQRLRRKEEAKESANAALKLISTIPKLEWNVEHYFTLGLSKFLNGFFEEAHQAYDHAIRQNSYYGGGVCWYNKACVYAQQFQKEDMLNALQKAMDIGAEFWYKEAPIDCDFEYYWQDEDFIKLMKVAESFS